MNKNLHRIVFNAARGTRMAVQETARSAGKAAGGGTTLVVAALALLATPLQAQIQADPGAPGHQRATVMAGPNGMPVVNIQTPSAAGVSRNVYRQFDVQAPGAVLNNSRSGAATQLAGQVPGNPWLARGPARIILNEVNSADPSQLRGYVEVAGQRAEVVIANPAGIQVDGAGFLNASRATLTTGTAQFSADGGLAGFLVRGGSIRVEGAGLDASQTDSVAILSRALQVNAGIWATELKVVTGTGEVSADAVPMRPTAASGSAPAFALDVAALGGMYAGKITLVGTEAGVGVRNAGRIGAGAGGLVVTASGRLENTGTIEAPQIALASAGDIDNRGGTLRQTGDQGLLLSAQTVRNTAGGVIGTPATATATGADPGAPAATPQATAPGTITAAGTLHNAGGHIQTGGTIALQTTRLDNQSGAALHLDTLAFTGEHLSNAGGTLNVRNAFSAEVGRFDNSAGTLQAGSVAIAATGDLRNAGGTLASRGDARLVAAGELDNTRGAIAVDGDLAVQAVALANTGGSIDVAGRAALDTRRFANAGGTLTLGGELHAAAQHLDNSAGQISAQSVHIATTGDLRNVGGTLASRGAVQLDVAGQWDNTRGSLASGQQLIAHAAGIVNDGGTLRADSVRLTAGAALRNAQGAIASAGDAQLVAGGELDNTQGRIASGRDLVVEAARLVGGGAVDVAGAMAFKGEQFTHAGGTLNVGQSFAAEVTHFDNSGGTVQAGSLRIAAHDGLTNAGGTLLSLGDARIVAGGVVDNARGALAVGTDLRVQASGLVNDGGQLDVAGTLAFTGEHLRNAADGQIHVNQAFSAQLQRLDNSAGTLRAGSVTITATGELRNAGGTLASQGTLHADAAALDNRAGTVHADSLRIGVQGAIHNAAGQLLSAGDASLQAGGLLDSTRGRIATGGDLALQAADLVNQHGVLDVAGHLAFTGQQFSNAAGQTQVGQTFSAQVRSFDNSAGIVHAADIRIATAGALRNVDGTLAAAGAVSLVAGAALDNTRGAIAAGQDLGIQATHLANSGTVRAGHDLALRLGDALQNDGAITAARHADITAASVLGGSTGVLGAGIRADGSQGTSGDLTVRAAQTLQAHGTLLAAGNATLTGASVDLTGGIASATQLTLTATHGDVRTRQAQVVARGTLAIGAGTQTLDNQGGALSAGQIAIDVANLGNAGGDIVQAGSGATRIAVAGLLDNSAGRIASNGDSLQLQAATLANTAGRIEHAGTGVLAIAATTFDGAQGRLASNGALALQAASTVHDGGSMTARQIAIDTGTLRNQAGQILHTGAGTARIDASGVLDNRGGLIATASGSQADLAIAAADIDNQGGRIVADGQLQARSGAGLQNTDGSLRAATGLAVAATGEITNTRGAIEAAGQAAALSLAGARLDNTDGRIANAGTGPTLLAADSIANGRSAGAAADSGLIAANGALRLQASTLQNQAGGLITAGTALDLAVTDTLSNRGTIASAGTLVFDQATARLDNAGGQIAAAGHTRIAVRDIANDGGSIATTAGSGADLTLQAQTLSNLGGTLASDRDLRLTLPGDYRNADTLRAGRDLHLTLGGALDNTGMLQAGAALHAQASAIDNAASGRIQGQEVDLQASGPVRNAGEITGAARVRIAAAEIANTGAITGGQVTLAAQAIGNTGPQALIGATGDLALWAARSLHNGDGATVYAGRDVFIAADDSRNAQGQLAQATGTVVNRAATIEAGRHIDIAAGSLLNERPGVAVEQVTVRDERHTLHMPSWWHNADPNGHYYAPLATNYAPYEVYYVNPADILENTYMVTPDGYQIGRAVLRTHANDTVFFSARAGRSGAYGHRERIQATDGTRVLYYQWRQDGMPNPDQVPGITTGVWAGEELVAHWDAAPPAFDPAYGNCSTQCVRLVTEPQYTDPNSIMIRGTQVPRGPGTRLSELSRDAHVVATEDRLAAGAGQAGRIVAAGDIRVGYSQSLTNQHSQILAGGQLRLDGAAGASLDNVATTLYRRYSFDGVRHYADGVTLNYQRPDIAQEIGSVTSVLSGAQGVQIAGGAIRNLDTSAGTAANIVQQVRLSSGSVAGTSGPAHATGGQAVGSAGAVDRSAALSGASGAPGAGLVASNGPDVRLQRADRIAPTVGSATGLDGGVARAPALPPGGLFTTHTEATSQHLYQTRAGFSSPQGQTSSDALFSAMGLDPSQLQKRLGDGLYEQRLVREQVAELTGRRYLTGQADDDAQYASLLSAGASFAQQYQLRPGVALSAAQMAALTSDIVWMETQTVTLADGSVQQVLAPKVYLAQVGQGAVHPGGALITGADIRIEGDSIVNRGGMVGGSGTGRAVLVARQDIVNQGGTVQADAIGLIAGRDVRNESLALTQTWGQHTGLVDATGSHTSLSNTARIQAGQTLQIHAGQDVVDVAGRIHADGDARVQAGRDVVLGTQDTGSHYQARIGTASLLRADTQAQVGQLSTGGGLALHAGRDLQLTGTQVQAGANASLAAGRHIDLQAARSSTEHDQRNDPSGTRFRQSTSTTTLQGASVQAGGNLAARAGSTEPGDLRVTASTLTAQGDTRLAASGDVQIGEGRAIRSTDEYYHGTSSGLLSRKTTTTAHSSHSDSAVGSTVGGHTVGIAAGRDVTVRASEVIADADLRIAAGRDLQIQAGTDTHSASSLHAVKKSGLLGSGGIGFTIGSQKQSGTQTSHSSTAVASTVGSVGGDVTLLAGQNYTQTGSDVLAPQGDVTVAAQRIRIEEARETQTMQTENKTSSSGLTVALSTPATALVQGLAQTARAMGKTQNARAQALGAASMILDATRLYDQAETLAKDPASVTKGINISISLGSSKSASQSDSRSDAATSSTVLGRHVTMVAQGAGADSSITVQGSDITGARDATLVATGAIDIGASRSTTEQHSSNKSSSASVGVSFGTNGLLFNAGASGAKGRGEGSELTHRNSHLTAGNHLALSSGGDTTLAGAVLEAGSVRADIGGDLSITSLQDQARSDSVQKSGGVSISVGAGVWSANLNLGQSKATGDYASVTEQSGIRAGDGGFDIRVQGSTELRGAVVGSTQAAVDAGRNHLQTAALVAHDIENHSVAKATSSGLSIGTDMFTQGKYGLAKGLIGNAMDGGSASESDASTTRSAVSSGSLAITDEAQQLAATGQTAEQTVAALNRQPDQAHEAVRRFDVQAMQEDAQAQQTLKNAAFKTMTVYTDDAYKALFKNEVKYYRVTCSATQSECMKDPSKRVMEPIDAATAKSEGTILAVNGILNDKERAGQLAYQNASLNEEKNKPESIVLMHIAPAQTNLGEFLVAGYETVLASTLGYSNADIGYADLVQARGQEPTLSMGHSRGTIVQSNAFEILKERGFANSNLSVEGVGIAVGVDEYRDAALKVIGPSTEPAKISTTYMANDAISVIAARNPGDALAALKEFYNVIKTNNSAHSCYGTGAEGCKTIANPVPDGPVPTAQQPGNVKVYRHGQSATQQAKP